MGDLIKVNFNPDHKNAKISKFRAFMNKTKDIAVNKVIPVVIGGLLIAQVILVSKFMGDAVVESTTLQDNEDQAIVYELDEKETNDYREDGYFQDAEGNTWKVPSENDDLTQDFEQDGMSR